MADYGGVNGVLALVAHVQLDQPNNPTTNQVNDWLIQHSALLDGWLAAAGYTTPVTHVKAKLILDHYANAGTAGMVELAQRVGGTSSEDDDKRENRFLSEFEKAKAYIESEAFRQLGAEHSDAAEAPSALSFVPATYGAAALADEFARPLEYWP